MRYKHSKLTEWLEIAIWGFVIVDFCKPLLFGGYFDINLPVFCILILVEASLLFAQKKANVVFIAIIFISIFLFIIISSMETGNFQYYQKWLLFCLSMIHYYFCYQVPTSDRVIRFIYYCVLIQCIFVVFGIFSAGNYSTSYAGARSYTLAFSNQNNAAMYFLVLLELLFILTVMLQKKGIFLFNMLLLAGGVFLAIYRTNARSSLLGVFFFLFFVLKKSVRFSKLFISVCILFPLVFAILYMVLYKASPSNSINFLGSTIFNGRQIIWGDAFLQIKSHPLLGAYNHYMHTFGNIVFQLHNGVVDLLASFGIPATTFFLFIVYKALCSLASYEDRLVNLCIAAILSLFIQSVGEAAFLIGGRMALVGAFVILAKMQKTKIHSLNPPIAS